MFYKVFAGRTSFTGPAVSGAHPERAPLAYLATALTGLWFGMAALPVQAQQAGPSDESCAAILHDFSQVLHSNRLDISATPRSLKDGGCAFDDVVITGGERYAPGFYADTVTVYGSILAWDRKGQMPSSDIVVGATGMRFATKMGDARMDYLLGAQARVGEMVLDLRAAWDGSAKEVEISRFDLTFAGDSRILFTARAKNIDLSTPGAAQMAIMGAALTDLDLEIRSFGLFEQLLLPVLVMMIPDTENTESDAGFAALVSEKKLELRTAINQLPDAAFPAPSRAALAALLSDLPGPRGKLVVNFRSASGFGAARFARFALTGLPQTMKELAPLFDGTRFDIDWRRGDRS
ncbi:hypothetical protein [Rhodobacter sp. 24-YEA-8]|uniref:hypothetical protein n=1 Tax=Rhodobacter sp. 24-YEA-8 TaxID=1884310 RepID=UPI0008971934|nr:hypothetical protein [Rhodobacter sp. 24-YEA-8]SEB99666.1 hypothetical protein SAMN05519105_1736 [Rhodobacter sp. 24-YEA-8]